MRDASWLILKNSNDSLGGFWIAQLFTLDRMKPPDSLQVVAKVGAKIEFPWLPGFSQYQQIKIALAKMRTGDVEEALHVATDSSIISSPLTNVTLALVHHRLKNHNEAARLLEQVEGAYSSSVQRALADSTFVPALNWTYWNEFMILHREAHEMILGKRPTDDPWLLLMMARERMRNGFALRADRDFKQAVELRPDDSQLWAARGRIYAELGLLDRVAADFDRAGNLATKPAQSIVLARAAARSAAAADAAKNIGLLDEFRRRALDAVRSALKAGFADKESLRTDPELKSIQNLPEFQSLIE